MMQLPFSQEYLDDHRAGTADSVSTELDTWINQHDRSGRLEANWKGGWPTDNGMLNMIKDYAAGTLVHTLYSQATLSRISMQLANISASLENISYQLGSRPADPGQVSSQNRPASSPSQSGPGIGSGFLGRQKPSGRGDSNSYEIETNWNSEPEDPGNDTLETNFY